MSATGDAAGNRDYSTGNTTGSSFSIPGSSSALSGYPTHLLNTLVAKTGGLSVDFDSDTTHYPRSDSDPNSFSAASDDKVIPGVNRIEAAREVATKVIDDNYDKMQIGLASFDSQINLGCDATKSGGFFDPEGQRTALIGANADLSNAPVSTYDSGAKVDSLIPEESTPLSKTMNAVNDYFNGTSSPIKYRCQKNFAIVMTDGDPNSDESTSTGTLDKRAQQAYDTDFKRTGNDSAGKDWNTTEDPGTWGKQNLVTYTIGFGLENDLLKRTPLVDRKTITQSTVVGNTITLANHGLKTGDLIEVVSGATLSPSATASASPSQSGKYYYYVARMSADTFKLTTTKPKATTCASGTTADCSTITATADVVLSIGPGKSYFAFTPEGLAQSLNAAFSEIRNLTASASAVSANSKQLGTSTLVYQANFNTEDWSGTVAAYPLDQTTGQPNMTTPTWTTTSTMNSASERTANIFTWNDSLAATSAAVTFDYANLSNNQKAYISNKPVGSADATIGGNVVSWIKGQDVADTKFRAHPATGLMGDVINADPVYVGSANYGYNKLPASPSPTDSPSCSVSGTTSTGSGCTGAETYAAFVTTNTTRTPMLYVGANDGVLHGLTANSGAERVAYVPAAVYQQWNDTNDNNVKDAGETENKLFSTTQREYIGTDTHHFFVDGASTAADAFIGNNWKTYLVGGLGAGGRSYFALDITNPSAFTTSVAANSVVKWEFMNDNLGYSFGKPIIGRLGNNKWYAFFPNGTDSR